MFMEIACGTYTSTHSWKSARTSAQEKGRNAMNVQFNRRVLSALAGPSLPAAQSPFFSFSVIFVRVQRGAAVRALFTDQPRLEVYTSLRLHARSPL